MKRTLFLSLLLGAVTLPLYAVEWNTATSGNQSVAEDVTVNADVNVGDITFNGDSTVTGTGSIGGSGNLTVNSGTAVFDGVSRPNSTGNITIASGASLEIKNGAKLLTNGWHNSSSVVTVNGTLKLESLGYGGSLGNLHDNIGVENYTDSLIVNGGGRIEITEDGSATIGARLNGWGAYFTFAVAEGKSFSWNASTNGNVIAHNGAGSVLVLDAGEGATFSLGKNIGTGLTIQKSGTGTLVLNSTINLDEGRMLSIVDGTVKFGDNAHIASAGSGFNVYGNATMDLDGKSGLAGQAVTVYGSVVNAQNNAMQIRLESTGTFSISEDATSGSSGSLIMTDGATVDLGGYVFYNTIDISNGGSVLNAEKHQGLLILGMNEDWVTELDSDMLSTCGGTLGSNGSIEASISEDLDSVSPEVDLAKGRLYAGNSVSIAGSGVENVTISGYTSEYGAVSAQNGDIIIADVADVTLSNNAATNPTIDDYNRAGALSATGAVKVEAAGAITISGNSASSNSTSGGAVYAGWDISMTGASITLTGNSIGSGDADNPDYYSGGALKSDSAISLTSTEGNIEISSNTADEAGGALYSSTGVDIYSAADIAITGNKTLVGDGGAVYSDGNVTITPGEGGSVTISGNEAGGYGGAIYSYDTVSLSGGSYEITDNAAGGSGGAIFAYNVELTADAGNIVFSGNTHEGGIANDVALDGGSATLTATGGNKVELNGGITGASEIYVETDEESAVRLGGYSSTESLSIVGGRVDGIVGEDGAIAQIDISSSLTLDGGTLQDIALVASGDEVAMSGSGTYVFNSGAALEFMSGYSDDSLATTVQAVTVNTLLNGFAMVEGELAISLTKELLEFALAQADGAALDMALTLMIDETTVVDGATFTFSLTDEAITLLEGYNLTEYGFYNGDDELLGEDIVEVTEPTTVVFSIKGLIGVVPEPTTTTLSLLALSVLAMRRRRR